MTPSWSSKAYNATSRKVWLPRMRRGKPWKNSPVPSSAIALVLSSVFVPTAFIPGITGRLYQQFAVTIAISVVLSAFNALTLSPALAALLLRPKKESRGLLRRFFDWFNRMFGRGTETLCPSVRWFIRKGALALVVIAAFAVGAAFFGSRLPSSFLPDEDQGYALRQHATSECGFAGAHGSGIETG